MILPKYLAVQAYLEATGTAFADLRYIEPLLEKMLERKEITADIGREVLGHKSDVAKTVFNLFQHIGITKTRVEQDSGVEYHSLTNYGRFMLQTKKENQTFVQPLTPFFLNWLPFKIFLKYLHQTSGADLNNIRTILGTQIVKHTSDMKELFSETLIRRGAHIPFNEMVISKVLANIGEFLGLTSSEGPNGPYYLSPLGKYVIHSLDFLNFQLKNLDPGIRPDHLALADFIERGLQNVIVFGDASTIEKMKNFYRLYEEKFKPKQIVNMIYSKNTFNALISTDSAFWSFANIFSNITYDQVKVLEFNSKVMDFIQV